MAAASPIQVTNFRELERWDVKYFTGHIVSKYPLVPLSKIVYEHNEKIRPAEYPDQIFKILGVNNTAGIFHAYDTLGKKIKQPYKKVSAGDFAYNPYRINVGSIGLVPEEHGDGYISPAYVVFDVDKTKVLPGILQFILKSDFFNKALRAATAGSVRMNLTYPLLKTLRIPVPPYEVQQHIVETLNRVNKEAFRLLNKSEKELLDISVQFYKALGLRKLKKSKLGRVFLFHWMKTERWGVEVCKQTVSKPDLSETKYPLVKLKDVITDLQNGWSPKCHNWRASNDEWGVLKVGAASYGIYDDTQNKALPKKLKPITEYEVKTGDLIISRANISRFVGACALVKKTRSRLMLCDKLFRVIWKKQSPILPEYLDEALKIPHLRWQIENNLTGASPTMKNISKPALLNLTFPLPSLSEQKMLMEEVEGRRIEASRQKDEAQRLIKKTEDDVRKMILGLRPVEGI